MSFAAPLLLWGLLLLPLALLAYLFAQRRRGRYAVRFTNLDLLANVVPRSPGWRRHLPPLLYLLTLGLLLLGLARPQATIPVPREEATVVLAIDVSRSMGATDVEPNRLEAARQAVDTFVAGLPARFRVGLIAFSDSVDTAVRPTTDRSAVRAAIAGLRPEAGTAMGDAIDRAVAVAAEAGGLGVATPAAGGFVASPAAGDATPPAAVLLLSDGANTAGRAQPAEAATRARQQGVPVFTIAFGTAEGVLEEGARRMPVPPDEATLRTVAETTGARFFAAPSADELRAVYADLGSRIGTVEEERELTAFFAGAGLILLVVAGTLSLVWFNRFP